jgi:hypothetical protein
MIIEEPLVAGFHKVRPGLFLLHGPAMEINYDRCKIYGAATRIRTGDPRITNALLYQLSYCGNVSEKPLFAVFPLVGRF